MHRSVYGAVMDWWPAALFDRRIRPPVRWVGKEDILRIRAGIAAGCAWKFGSGVAEYWIGSYELRMQAVVRKVLREGDVAFDVGANAGFYTVAMSRIVGPMGHVFAFEPLGENVQNLLLHRRLNGCENCSVVQCAVADRPSVSSFVVAETNAEGGLGDGGSRYYVPTVSLDQFIREQGTRPPNLIKIDVEGVEHRVLIGAAETLRDHDVRVLLALHGPSAFRDCHEMLTRLGYRIFDLNMVPLGDASRYVDEVYCHRDQVMR